MALYTWILPILIGIVADVLLLTILFYNKQRFADLGALIQLESSRPYYGIVNGTVNGLEWIPLNNSSVVPPGATQGQISGAESPLWMNGIDGTVNYPIYNYYPKAPLNPAKKAVATAVSSNDGAGAVVGTSANPPQVFDSHKAHYWALSGGYVNPFPLMVMPPTNMDNVRGVEDKI